MCGRPPLAAHVIVAALGATYSSGESHPPLRLERLHAAAHEQLRRAGRHGGALLSACVFGHRLHQLCKKPIAPQAAAAMTAALAPSPLAPRVHLDALLGFLVPPATGHTLELARVAFPVFSGTLASLVALGRPDDAERLAAERLAPWATTVVKLLASAPAAGWVPPATAAAAAGGGSAPPPPSLTGTLLALRTFQQGVCDALIRAGASDASVATGCDSSSGSADVATLPPLEAQLRTRTSAFVWLCRTAACRCALGGEAAAAPQPSGPSTPPVPPPLYAGSPSAVLLHVLGASRWSIDDYLRQLQAGAGSGSPLSSPALRPVLDACKRLYAAIREGFPQPSPSQQQGSPTAAASVSPAPSALALELSAVWRSAAVHDAFFAWMQRYAKLCRAGGDSRAAVDVGGSTLAYLQRRLEAQSRAGEAAGAAAASGGSPESEAHDERAALQLSMVELRLLAAVDAIACARPALAALQRGLLSSEAAMPAAPSADTEQAARHLQGAVGILTKLHVPTASAAPAPLEARAHAAGRVATCAEAVCEVWAQCPLAAAAMALAPVPSSSGEPRAVQPSSSSSSPVDWLVHLEQTAAAAAKHFAALAASAAPSLSQALQLDDAAHAAAALTAAARCFGVAGTARLLKLHCAPVAAASSSSRAACAADALARLRACGLLQAPADGAVGNASPLLNEDALRRYREAAAYAAKAAACVVDAVGLRASCSEEALGALSAALAPLHSSASHYFNAAVAELGTLGNVPQPTARATRLAAVAADLAAAVCSGWETCLSRSLGDAQLSYDIRRAMVAAARPAQRYQLLCASLRVQFDAVCTVPASAAVPAAGTAAVVSPASASQRGAAASPQPALADAPALMQAGLDATGHLLSWSVVDAMMATSPSAASLTSLLSAGLRKGGLGAIISCVVSSATSATRATERLCAAVEAAVRACASLVDAPQQHSAARVRLVAFRALADVVHRAVVAVDSTPSRQASAAAAALCELLVGVASTCATACSAREDGTESASFICEAATILDNVVSASSVVAPDTSRSDCLHCAPLRLVLRVPDSGAAGAHAAAPLLLAMRSAARGCTCAFDRDPRELGRFRALIASALDGPGAGSELDFASFVLHACLLLGQSDLVHRLRAHCELPSQASPPAAGLLRSVGLACRALAVVGGDAASADAALGHLGELLSSATAAPVIGLAAEAVSGCAHSAAAEASLACYGAGSVTALEAAHSALLSATKAWSRVRAALASEPEPAVLGECAELLSAFTLLPVSAAGVQLAVADQLITTLTLSGRLWSMRGDVPRALHSFERAASAVKAAGGALVISASPQVPQPGAAHTHPLVTRYQQLLGELAIGAARTGSQSELQERATALVAFAGLTPAHCLEAPPQPASVSSAQAHALVVLAACAAEMAATSISVPCAGIDVATAVLTRQLASLAPSMAPGLAAFAWTAASQLTAQAKDFAASASHAKRACSLLGDTPAAADDQFGCHAMARYLHGAALLRFEQVAAAAAELRCAVQLMLEQPLVHYRPHRVRAACRALALAEHRRLLAAVAALPPAATLTSCGSHAALLFASIAPAARYRCMFHVSRQELAAGLEQPVADGAGMPMAACAGLAARLRAQWNAGAADAAHTSASVRAWAALDPLVELRGVLARVAMPAASDHSPNVDASGFTAKAAPAQSLAWMARAAPLVALAVEPVTRTLLVARWEPPNAAPSAAIGNSSSSLLSLSTAGTVARMCAVSLRVGADSMDRPLAAGGAEGGPLVLGRLSDDRMLDACAEFDAILSASGASLAANASAAAVSAGLAAPAAAGEPSSSVMSLAAGPAGAPMMAPVAPWPQDTTAAPAAAPLGRAARAASSSGGAARTKISAVGTAAAAAAPDGPLGGGAAKGGARGRSASLATPKAAVAGVAAAAAAATAAATESPVLAGDSAAAQALADQRGVWWAARHALDDRLRRLCAALQSQLLQHAASLLVAPPGQRDDGEIPTLVSAAQGGGGELMQSDAALVESLAGLALAPPAVAAGTPTAAPPSGGCGDADASSPVGGGGASSGAVALLLLLLPDMKVAELKRELASRGLPTDGNKPELLARLREALSGSGGEGGEAPGRHAASHDAPGGDRGGPASPPPPPPSQPLLSRLAPPTLVAPGGGGVCLVLGEELQHLPWESLPCLRGGGEGGVGDADEHAPLPPSPPPPLTSSARAQPAGQRHAARGAAGSVTRLPTHALAMVHWNRRLQRAGAAAMEGAAAAAAAAAPAFEAAAAPPPSPPPHLRPTDAAAAGPLAGVPSCRPASPPPGAAPTATAAAAAPPPPPRGYAYLLNPAGDLARTQRVLQPVLDAAARCAREHARGMPVRGLAGRAPAPGQLGGLLAACDLYVYCGHGGGEAYLPREALCSGGGGAAGLGLAAGCTPAPPSLLMGCSSGRLVARGAAGEPDGLVLALLTAGCPSVVGALWDVTDKDIDRFTQALLACWLLPPRALAPTEGGGGDGGGSGGGGGGADDGGELPLQPWLPRAVAQCRAVCRLPFLVGAAPVVYGLPVLAVP